MLKAIKVRLYLNNEQEQRINSLIGCYRFVFNQCLSYKKQRYEYKSLWYGRELVFVSRWFPSSKTCCKCGWKNNNLTLSDREFICGGCGNTIDMDINAAINIKNEGIKIRQRLPESFDKS